MLEHEAWSSPKAERAEHWLLVTAAQTGDEAAFGALYRIHEADIYAFVRRRTSDATLAQDLTQDTFVRALRNLHSVSDRGSSVGAWLTTIARNLIIDHYRSSRSRRELLVDQVSDSGRWACSAEDCVIEGMTAETVRRAVQQLPEAQRLCITLRFLGGFSLAETADLTDSNIGSVKATQHRAVQRLRLLLATEDPCRLGRQTKTGCAVALSA
jgi:RNA polymerase sigma-70 factor (ECF subfamily)